MVIQLLSYISNDKKTSYKSMHPNLSITTNLVAKSSLFSSMRISTSLPIPDIIYFKY